MNYISEKEAEKSRLQNDLEISLNYQERINRIKAESDLLFNALCEIRKKAYLREPFKVIQFIDDVFEEARKVRNSK